jgi:RNA polymerase sigma-70 factor (ECF subfamily)
MGVLAGEEDRRRAFEVLVAPEVARLYRIAVAILDDPHEAEDAVQDTLLLAWRAWASLRRREDLSAWLTRICVHRCLRQRHVLRRWITSGGQGPPAPVPGVEPAELGERLVSVQHAMHALSPPQRAMIVLHLCDGYTVTECAAVLRCRPGTARSHLGRAMSKLRKELADV